MEGSEFTCFSSARIVGEPLTVRFVNETGVEVRVISQTNELGQFVTGKKYLIGIEPAEGE